MQRLYENEPPFYRGDEFYIKAFWDLCSERQFGHVLGPIPWSKIIMYGHYKHLDDITMSIFERVIRELDETYIAWNKANQKRG